MYALSKVVNFNNFFKFMGNVIQRYSIFITYIDVSYSISFIN